MYRSLGASSCFTGNASPEHRLDASPRPPDTADRVSDGNWSVVCGRAVCENHLDSILIHTLCGSERRVVDVDVRRIVAAQGYRRKPKKLSVDTGLALELVPRNTILIFTHPLDGDVTAVASGTQASITDHPANGNRRDEDR